MKYILFSLFFLGISVQLQAQNPPGYMGKRFYANLNIHGAIAAKGPTAKNNGLSEIYLPQSYNITFNGSQYQLDTPSLAFNLRYELALRYIIGRKVQIGLNYGRLRTGFHVNSPYTGSQSTPIFYTANVNTVDFSIDLSKNLAPLGTYLNFGPGVAFGKGKHDESNPFTEPAGIDSETLQILPYIRVGTGFRHVWFDQIVFNAGVDFILNTNPGKTFSTNRSSALSEHYEEEFKARMARHLVFNISVGLGYLIF